MPLKPPLLILLFLVFFSTGISQCDQFGNYPPIAPPANGGWGQNFLMGTTHTLQNAAYVTALGIKGPTLSVNVRMALYTNNNGTPGTLVATTNTFATGGGTMTSNVTTPTLVPPGQYFIMFVFQTIAWAIPEYTNNPVRTFKYIPHQFSFSVPNSFTSAITFTASDIDAWAEINTFSVTPSYTICAGNSTVLSASSASGQASFTWSTGQNSASITVSPSVTTVYTVSALTGTCISSETVQVVVEPVPVMSITATPSVPCAGESVTLNVSGAWIYLWDNASQSPSIVVSPAQTTTYSVIGALFSGCFSSNSIVITPVQVPTLTIAQSSGTICAGSPLSFTASGAGSYLWSNGATSSVITVNPLSNTIYSVTGNNSGLCFTTASVAVVTNSVPLVSVSPQYATVCAMSPASFTASGAASYIWSNGATGQTAVINPPGSAIYSVTGTDGANNCQSTVTLAITTNTNPLISVSGSTSICAGQSTTLSAQGAQNLSWSTGLVSASLSISPSVTTTYSVWGNNLAGCSATLPVLVTVNPIPTLALVPLSNTVCVFSNATFTASGADSYSWSNGATGNVLNVAPSAGTVYSVTGSSAAGCSSSATVSVFTNSLPLISISPAAATVCAMSQTTFVASGALSYTWSNGSTAASTAISPPAATVLIASGTDPFNGCVGNNTVSITTNSLPLISVSGPTAICIGQNASLTASGSNSLNWNTGVNGPALVVSPITNSAYVATGTNSNGCIGSASIQIQVNPLPVITVVAGTSVVCANSPVSFTAGGASTYTWSSGATGNINTISPVSSSAYTVYGSSTAGCVGSATVSVLTNSLPVITISPSNPTVCALTAVNFTASGAGSYTWSNGAQNNLLTVYPGINETYSVSGTDPNNGCISSATAAITTNSLPLLTVSGPSAVCSGNNATLIASGGNNYAWNTGAVTASINIAPVNTTTYLLSGSNLAGCSATLGFVLTVNPLPTLLIAQSNTAVCMYTPVSFTASGASSYLWNTGANTSIMTVSPASPITYVVIGTDGLGCESTQSVAINTYSIPVVNIVPGNITACAGDEVIFNASGAATYTWQNGVASNSLALVTLSPLTVSVTGSSAEGCENSTTANLLVETCTSLQTHDMSGLQVFPNPFTNRIAVISEVNEIKKMILYDNIFRIIFTADQATEFEHRDFSGLSNGIYYLRIQTTAGSTIKKIIKN